MAFDEIRLPLRIGYGSSGGTEFMTDVVTVTGGYERRNQNWSQARRRFDARTGVTTAHEATVLLSFFQARAGKARGFRLKDWNDHTSHPDGVSSVTFTDQTIGIGDGIQTQFQLIKKYGFHDVFYYRDIRKPVENTVKVGVDNTLYESEWSVDLLTGIITFVQPPIVGAQITAGYEFDVPVRFDTDKLNLTSGHPKLSEHVDPIPLIEVRI